MDATFNLNSGLYGKQQVIGNIGTLGCKEVPIEEFRQQKCHLLKYVPHCRITEKSLKLPFPDDKFPDHSGQDQ